MKKLIYLFSITLMLTITSATANAATTTSPAGGGGLIGGILDLLGLGGGSGSGSGSGSTPAGGGGSTQLPINNGVVFLMIAGTVIGIATIKRNSKTAATKG